MRHRTIYRNRSVSQNERVLNIVRVYLDCSEVNANISHLVSANVLYKFSNIKMNDHIGGSKSFSVGWKELSMETGSFMWKIRFIFYVFRV